MAMAKFLLGRAIWGGCIGLAVGLLAKQAAAQIVTPVAQAAGTTVRAISPPGYRVEGNRLLRQRIEASYAQLQREPASDFSIELFVTGNSDPARMQRFLLRARKLVRLEDLNVLPEADGEGFRIRVTYGRFADKEAATRAVHALPEKYRREFTTVVRSFAELRGFQRKATADAGAPMPPRDEAQNVARYFVEGNKLVQQRIEATRARLSREPGENYSIELFVTGNTDLARMQRFLLRARKLVPLEEILVLPESHGSASRLRVAFGDYPDKETAGRAIDTLPDKYKREFKPVLRSFAELRAFQSRGNASADASANAPAGPAAALPPYAAPFSPRIDVPRIAASAVIAPPAPAPEMPQSRFPRPALRPWRITPLLNVSLTYTDNVNLAPAGSARSDLVKNISPGIRAEGSGPRIRGYFDYRINDVSYANESRLNNRQNALDSLVTVELLEGRFFVDLRGNVSQQNRSAFSPVSSDATTATANRVETSVYQLGPYWRGQISDVARYQVRLNATHGSTRGIPSAGTDTIQWLGGVQSASGATRLTWAVDASALTVRNSSTGGSRTSRGRGSLTYEYDAELHFSVFQGFETADFAGASRQSTDTPGIGVAWTPSQRTQATWIREQRFFGSAQTLKLSHRASRMAFRYSDDKEVAVLPNLVAASGPGSLSGLMSDLLASSIPDPALRAQAVSARLASTGQSADPVSSAGFQTNQAFLRRNRLASLAITGVTNTVTLTWNSVDQQTVGTVAGQTDSFAANTGIRQQILSAAWTLRASELTNLTLIGTRGNTLATGGAGSESTQRTLNLVATRRFSPRSFVSLGLRHGAFDSTVVAGNRENAILATLSARF